MAFQQWKEEHQALWEFILFNILSNVSTAARFVVTWVGTALTGGAGTAVVFLAELASQVVNYFVQMKLVFKSDASARESAWKYAVLAVIIVVVNLILPGYVTDFCTATFGMDAGLAGTVASFVNTLLAVVVSFPLLQFWIAPAK